MGHVFVTSKLPGDGVARMQAAGHTVDVWTERRRPDADELVARAHGADAILCTLLNPIDGALLDRLPHVRTVANYGVGYDNVDVPAAHARGVAVSNTPDVVTDATADLAFALLLAVARRLPQTSEDVRAGRWGDWQPTGLLGHDLVGSTLGIVGAGRIGDAVARRAAGFAMTVLKTTSRGGTPFQELLERSDYVSLHVPLTPATRHLIDAAALERMKPTAILVNTARGAVVDTDALTAALQAGAIAGAGLDVTDPEPLPADHPLLAAPNVLVVPHIGSATRNTRVGMADLTVDNVLAGLAGEPLPQAVPAPRA